jgi:hypothetical protein
MLKVNEKPTNALTVQCIGTQSATCFGILKCHHQGVKHYAGLLARSQYPEGPSTGQLDTGFSWFPCV